MLSDNPGVPGVKGIPGEPGHFEMTYLNLRTGKKITDMVPKKGITNSFSVDENHYICALECGSKMNMKTGQVRAEQEQEPSGEIHPSVSTALPIA